MVYRLRDAGVRVPIPYHFVDGVLVMEMITDAEGNPAPRLCEICPEPEEALRIFEQLLAEVVRMLAAGVVHGDLSDFNVLMGADGPVVIDFPQAVSAANNQNARKLLLRDVDNLHRFAARFVPDYRPRPYAQEMWALYERSLLTPETKLTGRHQSTERKANTNAVLALIGDAARDERRRRENLGLRMRGTSDFTHEEAPGHGEATAPGEASDADRPQGRPRRVEIVVAPRPQRGGWQGNARSNAFQGHGPYVPQHQANPRQPGPDRSRPNQGQSPHARAQRPGAYEPAQSSTRQAGFDRSRQPQGPNPNVRPPRPLPQETVQGTERPQSPERSRQHQGPNASPRPERPLAKEPAQGRPPERPGSAVPRNQPAAPGGSADQGAERRRRRRRRRRSQGDPSGAVSTPGSSGRES